MSSIKPYKQYINGEWVNSTSDKVIEVINPVTEEIVATVQAGTKEDVDKALVAAKNAQDAWEDLPSVQRGKYLHQMADVIRNHRDELVALLTEEQAKVTGLSQAEIDTTADYFDYYAGFARRIEGEIIPSDRPDEVMYLHKQAIGVAAGILPWNFPMFVMVRKVAAALITGNTIVIKPSQEAPITVTKWLEYVDKEMDLPAGVLNVVNGTGSKVGQALCESPIPGIISLTGSVGAGRMVMKAAAENITKVSLELGGKAPVIVCKDADLDMTVQAVIDSRLINSGQACNCAERIYVEDVIYDEFVERAKKIMESVKVTNPLDPECAYSAQISKNQLDSIDGMVRRAVEEGATIVTGGKRMEGKGFFFQPTLITNVSQKSEIIQEEIFGPVLPIMKFSDLDEAIDMANDSDFGLTSSVFSEDYNTVMYVQRKLKFGEVYVNREHFEAIQGFHAGWRKSGIGGADGKHGMQEYLQTKVVYAQVRK